MSLSQRARKHAEESHKANKKIGFIGQVVLTGGQVPRVYGDEWDKAHLCFVPTGTKDEATVRNEVKALVGKHITSSNVSIYTCLEIKVIEGSSLTPNNKLSGSSYVSTEAYVKNSPRTHKRVGDFLFDHMSPELDSLEGKKVWVHISWNRLTEEYGGDLTLQGNNETRNEWGMILTYLPDKKAALELAQKLSDDEVSMDQLALARGYDAQSVRQQQFGDNKDANTAAVPAYTPHLTDLGKLTKQTYGPVDDVLTGEMIGFFEESYASAGSIEAAAEELKAEVGDVAIIVNDKEYLKKLMAQQTGSETENVVAVAELTGLANPNDLALFLGIEEIPF